MESNNNGGSLVPLLIVVGLYAAYRAIEAMIAALTAFLTGLVTVALGVAVILALFWVYRHLSDKQFGQTRNVRKIAQWERQREYHLSQVPEHLHEKVNEYYAEKMHALFDTRPHSRFDEVLDRTKQIISTFRRAA